MKHLYILSFFVLALVFYSLGEWLFFKDWIQQFWVLTASILAYNVIKLGLLFRKESTLFLINPMVIGCFTTIFLSQGAVTNWGLEVNGKLHHTWGEEGIRNSYEWLCMAMQGAGIGSLFMWLGYEMNVGRKIFYFYKKLLDKTVEHPLLLWKILIVAAFGYWVKMYLFSIGMFGYQALGLKTYINTRWTTFESLSRVTFVLLYLYRFKYPTDKLGRIAFITSFSLELLFAMAHGARSQVLYFFISIFILDYFTKKRINWAYIPIGAMLFFASFTIGSVFKTFYISSNTAKLNDPVTALSSFMKVRSRLSKKMQKQSDTALPLVIFGRLNYVRETAMVLRYKYGLKRPVPTEFKTELLTVPVFAFLPKFFIFGIQDFTYGRWVTSKIYGQPKSKTSTAMSPVGNLFMTGGIVLVAFGFFFYGVILRILYFLLAQNTIGTFFIFLAMLSFVNVFDSNVAGTFTVFIRYSVVLPIVYFLFFTKIKIR